MLPSTAGVASQAGEKAVAEGRRSALRGFREVRLNGWQGALGSNGRAVRSLDVWVVRRVVSAVQPCHGILASFH